MSWVPPWVSSQDASANVARSAEVKSPPRCSTAHVARESTRNKTETTTDQTTAMRQLWKTPPPCTMEDVWGLQRIPAFWFTLNLPYNHLHELHRLQKATTACAASFARDVATAVDPLLAVESSPPLTQRCEWVLNNPDLVAQIHAPCSLSVLRGKNCSWSGNPHFETVLKEEDSRKALRAAGRQDLDFLPTWEHAEAV